MKPEVNSPQNETAWPGMPSAEQTAELLPATAVPRRPPAARGVVRAMPPAALSAAPDPVSMLRAFKRRLPLALAIGLMAAAVVGPLAWFLVPESKYTASAILNVRSKAPTIAFDAAGGRGQSGDDYKRFQESQRIYVKSRKVLEGSLVLLAESDEFRKKSPKLFEGVVDKVEWLQQNLDVSFINGSEMMRISLSGDYPTELAAIVNAVEEAYEKEVINVEHKDKVGNVDRLKAERQDKQAKLDSLRAEIKALVEKVGSDDRTVNALKQQLVMEQKNYAESELRQVKSARRKLEAQLKVLADRIEARRQAGLDVVPEEAIDRAVEAEPTVAAVAAMYAESYEKLRRAETQIRSVARNSGVDPVLKKMREDTADIKVRLEQLKQAARPQVEARLRQASLQEDAQAMTDIQMQLAQFTELEHELNKDVAALTQNTQDLGLETLAIQRAQDDLMIVRDAAMHLSKRIEEGEVELKADARIELMERAVVPKTRDDKKRYMMIAGATLMSFFGCLGLVTFLEFQSRRVGSAEEVVQGLGIHLVGALPPIPARARRRGGSRKEARGKDAYWYNMMLESIDSTRTVLLHAAKTGGLRVMMVTSALGGEGKTSLSSHLATSLARAGRKTLLIDGDLRSPSICRLFDLAPNPGLADVLRGQVAEDTAIVPTRLPNLMVLPAGTCDALAIQQLAQGQLGELIERLRDQYDFIVLDSSPILPVSDALVMAPHADAVVFSVLRDVSRMTKVFAAYQRLAALGVRILGAVVSGVHGGLYGNDYRYPYAYPNRPRATPTSKGPEPSDAAPGGEG